MYFPDTAAAEFLKNTNHVRFNTGVPTWDHWECVDGEWVIVTYAVGVDLTPIGVRHETTGSPAGH